MSLSARVPLTHRLVFLAAGLLLGCPQLLEDDFGTLAPTPDGGEPVCAGGDCSLPGGNGGAGGDEPRVSRGGQGGASTASAGAGGAGSRGGAGGGAGAGGSGGTTGSAGSAGVGGTSGTGGSAAGGTSGTGGAGGTSGDPACWVISLDAEQQTVGCLGIDGWNDIEVDSPSSVDMTYANGKVCFDGTIATSGWGAVYNFAFNTNEYDPWNASSRGVGGFELGISGSLPPPRIDFKYTIDDQGDWCRSISPVTTVEIPFASTHPGCQPTGSVPDATKLTLIRLAMEPRQAAYELDFCVQLRALP